VLRIACRILGVVADAEDVTQDVFCEAWQIHTSREVANWPGLLRRLVVVRALDKLRRRRPHLPLTENHLAHDRNPTSPWRESWRIACDNAFGSFQSSRRLYSHSTISNH
jgi:DNA-directed RNA polymerase specialized sigma24 family protein